MYKFCKTSAITVVHTERYVSSDLRHILCWSCYGLFVPLSPVAYPKLNYALELGLRFSQFSKSSQYLIKVAQEIVRKRREAQDDAAYVKVWYIHCLHYKNKSVNGPLHYSIVFICHL